LGISENTLLYIIAGSFGSWGGGEGFLSTSGAVGEGCDLTVIKTSKDSPFENGYRNLMGLLGIESSQSSL
jgi:hypothetical protein